MPLPKVFQSQSTAIASYPAADLARNTGVQLFYGAGMSDGTGILTNNQVYSDESQIVQSASDATPTTTLELEIDKDFDLTAFNLPITVNGTAYVAGTAALNNVGTGTNCTYAVTVIFKKWDGSTETTIGTGTWGGTTVANNLSGNYVFLIPVTLTKTQFQDGEILRMTMEVWGKKNAAGGGGGSFDVELGCDPMNRDGTYIVPSTDAPVSTTQLKAWIPFDLDL